MSAALLIVVGLAREARIARDCGRVAIGAARIAGSLAGARGVVSFGLCGALDPALAAGDLVVADGVVGDGDHFPADPVWTAALRAALPGARVGLAAGSGAIVGSAVAKTTLRRTSGATIVDMETLAAAKAARGAGLPFAIVRAVSDTAATTLPRSAQAGFRADGEPDVAAVVAGLLRRPWELPALIRTARDAEKGFKALAAAAPALVPPPA